MSDRPLALFRCDGGPSLGAGHVMRCRALADRLDALGWRTQFAIDASSEPSLLGKRRVDALVLPDGKDPNALEAGLDEKCALLVVDHYGLDAEFEASSRSWSERICVFDDLADRAHDCDLLVDFTPGRRPDIYDSKAPPNCRFLMGPTYAPLRPEFFRARIERDDPGPTDGPVRLLIAPGATDPANIAGQALEAIRERGLDIRVIVALSTAAPHKSEVADLLKEMDGELRIDCNDMAREIADADLVLGAGGMSAWERCCLAAPTVMVVGADNQRANAEALAAAGAVELIDAPNSGQATADAIARLMDDRASLAAMARQASALCDGLGANRLAQAVAVAPNAKDGKPVGLRPANAGDAAIMLDWQRHPETRRFARNPAVPGEKEHNSWVAEKLADRRCVFNIVTHDGAPAGVLRFDHDTEKKGFEISILTAPDRTGLGIAGHALALGRELMAGWDLYAFVDEANLASLRLFQGSGYAETAEPGWLAARSDTHAAFGVPNEAVN